jgi:hypothetical protein
MRSLTTALLFMVCAAEAYGFDSYSNIAAPPTLTIPSLGIGSATYSTVTIPGLTIGDVVGIDNNGTPQGREDTYTPSNQHLFIPSVKVDSAASYTNVTVNVGLLPAPYSTQVKFESVSGADTYGHNSAYPSYGAVLSIPIVEITTGALAGKAFCNVVATPNFTPGAYTVSMGMPQVAEDQYNPATGVLTIPAVTLLANNAVYTNVMVPFTLADVLAYGSCGGSGSSSSSSGGSSSSSSSSGSSGSSGGGTSSSSSSSSSSSGSSGGGTSSSSSSSSSSGGSSSSSGGTSTGFVSFPDSLPAAGSASTDAIPAGAGLEDTSHPDYVIGSGTPASCTSAAVVTAVAAGGVITFNCGSAPVTIQMTATAQIFNNAAPTTVIDGGGLVTLSGMGQRRILYMNTCDQSLVWTTSACQNQEYPQLTVQNLTFTNGNASNETIPEGGAIYERGGRLKVVNSRFFSNVCASTGPDTAGGAIYSTEQYQGLPLYVVHSTFGGASTLSNICSNGGALGSIGVSWTVINSLLTYNEAVGNGGNPAASGTPGGGSGGAIYNDGDTMVLTINGSQLSYNGVTTFGSAIIFVSDNLTGSIAITDSTITGNTGGSWYPTYPQISNEPSTPITVINSDIAN